MDPELPDPTSVRPIFVVGAPRSGTTMLRFMLDRHPNVGLCDETHFFYYVHARRRHFGDLTDPENRRLLVERYLEMKNVRVLDLDNDALARTLTRHGDSYRLFFLLLLDRYARDHGKSRLGEKSPDHALHVDTLCRWYPRCRIVHIVRDPRAVVGSLRRMPWARNSVVANTRWWRRNTTAPLHLEGRENYLMVRYEDLVSDPEGELRRICRHVEEPFSEAMLEPEETEDHRPWSQRARRQVSRNRIDRWREELTGAQVALVERGAGPVMEELGYPRIGRSATPLEIVAGHAADVMDWARHTVRTFPRMVYYWLFPTRVAEEEAWIDRWKVPDG